MEGSPSTPANSNLNLDPATTESEPKITRRKTRKTLSFFLPENATIEDGEIPENQERRVRSRISEMSFATLNCPEEGATISFHDYCYRLKDKVVLDGISGHFRAGRLTAIMGPSGSGKTSLIETMTGSNLGASKRSVTASRLALNGVGCTREDIASLSGFVPQDDIFLSTMKVREALEMSANLRLPKTVSAFERKQRVEEILDMFNLRHCADTILGGGFRRGISGGEKRRVSIAREIIANPPLLFLDEPTTGLDSFTSLMVVGTLKELAQQGRTVVITIHQPSSEIFSMFDDLAVLVGGKVIYWGPCKRILRYFDHLGFMCPDFANPADFLFLTVLGSLEAVTPSVENQLGSKSIDFHQVWLQSPLFERLMSMVTGEDSSQVPEVAPLIAKASFIWQLLYLYPLYTKASFRSPVSLTLRLQFAVFCGLMVGLTFTNLRSSSFSAQIRGRAGALYYTVMCSFVAGFLGCLQVMWEDRSVFLHDYRSHYFDVTPAFLARMSVAIPQSFVSGAIVPLISYYMIGFDPAFSSLLFVALMMGTVQVAGLMSAIAVGYLSSDPQGLVPKSITLLLTFAMFGGVFILPPTIPGYLRWIVYINPVYYAYTGSMQIAYPDCNENAAICQKDVAFEINGLADALPAGVNFVLLLALTFVCGFFAWLSVYYTCRFKSK